MKNLFAPSKLRIKVTTFNSFIQMEFRKLNTIRGGENPPPEEDLDQDVPPPPPPPCYP